VTSHRPFMADTRPRDKTGRVAMPIRLEARFPSGTGYRRYFATMAEAAEWMASDPEFTATAGAVKAITIVRQDPDPGPEIARPARPRGLDAAIRDATATAA
jgi:hypothetical protein